MTGTGELRAILVADPPTGTARARYIAVNAYSKY
jgi:hypothetical protein